MKHRRITRYIINLILFGLSLLFILVGSIILFYVFTPLPDINIENLASKQSVILDDRNGEFLFDFSENEKRVYTSIDDISKNVINATIAIEDHLFFEHSGVRVDAFLRALLNNIQTLSFSQGGSTITQQVVKNVFLTTEKNIERKMKEFLLAVKLEKQVNKEKILELYLNTISYGGVTYGISEASNSFFGKKPSELTIAESAYLAAIPNAPTFFSPYGSHKPALETRKNTVLAMMLRYNFITADEYTSAKSENVYFMEQDTLSIQAPHFVFFVKDILEKKYGTNLKSLEGKRVRTTIDLELQKKIEDIITEFGPEFEKRYNGKNIASVVLSAKTGEILTMVGSKDFFDSSIEGRVNIITSRRQPGSTFKPIVYAKAFEKGLLPETVVYDVPTQFNPSCDKDKFETTEAGCYSPINYTGKFLGPVSLREALAQSINVPAVKTLYLSGIGDVIALAKNMGITSFTGDPRDHGLSLVLGSAEITPLELAQAYNVFANDGVFVPYTWTFGGGGGEKKRVLSKKAARYITNVLSDDGARAPLFGRRSPLHITKPQVAVKTGTTNNSVDLWVIGYSPDIVVLVWGGHSDGTPLEIGASGLAFSKTFRKIMLTASEKYGNNNLYFPINTTPRSTGNNMLSGIIDKEDPHTILHYIQKNSVTQPPTEPEDDSQYENWEFGVKDWLEKNKTGEEDTETPDIKKEIPISFSIQFPTPGSEISAQDIITIITTPIPKENTRYEFYVNNKLVGLSAIPFFKFNLSQVLSEIPENITIQALANSPLGVFSSEHTYPIKERRGD